MRAEVAAADRYWRLCSAIAAAHAFGCSWPPPCRPQRSRLVGHWGCNPGIAWVVAHLCAVLRDPDPFLLVVGTGHATSFLFAHDAITTPLPAGKISAASRRYGQPGGEPTELLGLPGVPFASGELGPGLAVAQGLAAASPDRLVVVVIRDGECETPAPGRRFAHVRGRFQGERASNLGLTDAEA